MTRTGLPRASLADTAAVLLLAAGPLIAKGLIVRRPAIVALLRRTGAEGRGIRLLARLRRKYGDRPLLLRLPLREQALILAPRDLRRVLAETPEPFAADSNEKRASLAHFQPDGVLISEGASRAERRRFNEKVLESGCPVHSLAPTLAAVVETELAPFRAARRVAWPEFRQAWYRIVRQIVFGAAARGDTHLTDMLERLRHDANWAFMKPRRRRLREQFLAAVRRRLADAPPHSLGGRSRDAERACSAPEDQIAHWLFAFDAAGIATFRTLAMLALHPDAAARARQEEAFRRACILETLRLWPTTPAVLRQTRSDTNWPSGTLPAGAGLLVHLPYFHRDPSRIPYADRFVPATWLDGRAEAWPFLPFSAGPVSCPARNLVLFLAAQALAVVIRGAEIVLPPAMLLDPARLPPTFDHFRLAIRLVAQETKRGAAQEPASTAGVEGSF